jgi:predicted DNA-binding protein (MmcQ/YjbR family)
MPRVTMDVDWLRTVCLSFPSATEQVQWGNDLLFKVHGKMFAVAPLEPAAVCLSFKCSEESFAELMERPNIIPAPYLARAKWVGLEAPDALTRTEIAALLKTSYELVFAKLPRSVRQGQEKRPRGKPKARRKGRRRAGKPSR